MCGMHGWPMGGMWIWWLTGPVLLALLIWAIWVVARPGGFAPRTDESPEAILKRRYARGEIEREEYERRLGDLRK